MSQNSPVFEEDSLENRTYCSLVNESANLLQIYGFSRILMICVVVFDNYNRQQRLEHNLRLRVTPNHRFCVFHGRNRLANR